MKKLTGGIVAALATALSATTALAGSELLPGISTGIPLGAPLPPGLYDITIPSWGSRGGTPKIDSWASAPVWIIWSTPWTLFGGHVLFDTVTPYVDVDIKGGPQYHGFANTFLDAQLKWDLGGGLFGGFQSGVYLPVSNQLNDLGISHDWASYQGIAALSYLKDGWDLSATLVYGTGHSGYGVDGAPSWFNYDLTATKKFDKFEFGAVAFGSTDLDTPYSGYQKQSQFAVGALAGYDFGPVNVQLKVTRDVTQENYTGKETRVWANIIIPLWTPKPEPKPVVAKF